MVDRNSPPQSLSHLKLSGDSLMNFLVQEIQRQTELQKLEAAVKQAKRLMKKAKSEGLNSSPAQRLLGRKTKTLLPTTAELLKPNSAPSIKEQVKFKEIQKNHTAVRMNASRKDLKPLKPGGSLSLDCNQLKEERKSGNLLQ
jgi:hypothetical protein